MPVVQVAAELRDDDRFMRRESAQARISFLHFESKSLRAVAHHWRGRSIGAERDTIAIVFTGKIILERVPFLFRLIEPVDVPNPGEIIGALPAHKIDNVPVGGDVALRAFTCATLPFSVPTEPLSVALRPPPDHNRRAKVFRCSRPRP